MGNDDDETTIDMDDFTLFQKERTDKYLKLALDLETQHSVPNVAIDKIFKTFHEDQRTMIQRTQNKDIRLYSKFHAQYEYSSQRQEEERGDCIPVF